MTSYQTKCYVEEICIIIFLMGNKTVCYIVSLVHIWYKCVYIYMYFYHKGNFPERSWCCIRFRFSEDAICIHFIKDVSIRSSDRWSLNIWDIKEKRVQRSKRKWFCNIIEKIDYKFSKILHFWLIKNYKYIRKLWLVNIKWFLKDMKS